MARAARAGARCAAAPPPPLRRRRRCARAVAGGSAGGEDGAAVVVGGGWAAFGAAESLSRNGFGANVTLLDAAPTPGGVAGTAASGGAKIELGIKGCWRHYRNVERMLEELGLPAASRYGPFSETAFYSPRGLEVVAPVLGECEPRLPAPLGPLAYTADRFTDLPYEDRLTAFPLMRALIEFDLDDDTYASYDRMSFEQLCRSAGVSETLYSTFLRPVLVALMFAPPRELSAAAALAVLSNYVLMHQSDFDVRWPTRAPSEVFERWAGRLRERGVGVRGGAPVKRVLTEGRGSDARTVGVELLSGEVIHASAVVLAAGASALPRIVEASDGLCGVPGLRGVGELQTSAVVAARFTKDGAAAPLPYPANVFGGLGGDIAGTFFDIGVLTGAAEAGRVVEVDTYNAADLVGRTDEELLAEARRALALADKRWANAAYEVGSARIARAGSAATHFQPGSHSHTPAMRPRGAPLGVYVAGDLVKQGPAERDAHRGARGLSQEKALVTGIAAGGGAATDVLGVKALTLAPLAVEDDEPHIEALKDAARTARAAGLRLPL